MTAEYAVICDAAGTIRSVTAVLAHLLGYVPDELVGRSFREFVTLSRRRQLAHDWARITSGDEATLSIRVVLRARDGGLLPALLDVTPLGRGEYLVGYQGAAHGHQQLVALNTVLSGLSGTLKLSQVFDLILEQVIEVVPGEYSDLILMRGKRLVPVRARGQDLETLRAVSANWLEFDTIRSVCETRRPQIINDCARDSRWRMLLGSEHIRSWIGIPLLYNGQLCGVLEVTATEPDRFTIADASAALLFAQQAAASIRYAQLYHAARARAARLSAINAVGLAMTRLDVADVVRLASERVISLMKADIFYIALYDAETNSAQFTEFYDRQWLPNIQPLALTGLIGYVIRRRETLFISDVLREDYPTATIDIGTGEDPRTVVIVPLITHDEVIGVLSVQSYQPDRWPRADVGMLETIASQTAVAIRNAQLYDAATARLDTLASLQRASAQMVGRLDVATILDLTAREVLQLLAPDEVQIYLAETPRTRSSAGDHPPQLTFTLSRTQTGKSLTNATPTPHSAVARVAAHATPVILDAQHPELLAEAAGELPNGMQPHLWVGYPIRRANQTYGVATLLYTRPHRFPTDQGPTLSLLLSQTANALENAQHAADMSSRLNELSALYRVADQITGKLDLDAILHNVVQTLYTIFPCRTCMIALRDPEPDDTLIRIRAIAGLPFESVSDLQFHLDKSIVGQAIQSTQPLYFPDLSKVTVEHQIDPALRSALFVPLTVHNRTFGVLAVASSMYEAFSRDHERILRIAAAQIAGAIDNARLYEETQERAKRLAAANRELRALDQLRTELVQNLSHELRSPLTFVKGYAGLLRTSDLGPVNAAQIDALTMIERKADTITRLVADLLTLETLDSRDLHVEPLNLTALTAQAVEGARLSRRDSPVRFETVLEADQLPITGDPDRLNQVFDNLLGNAVKFSPKGGVVAMHAWLERDLCCVSVSDAGIGIPPNILPHIFERFYQGDDTTRRRFGGAGLGLSIVKRIVEAHGGYVTVKSEVGAGSIFTVCLPHAESPGALYVLADGERTHSGNARHT
ncbi:MAG: GAF domain-containing protein [Aggregatilineales bacterium]